MTFEEYVTNERIVDHANLVGVWTFTFEPDEAGTTLTGSFGWDGDRDLDLDLANLKKAVES